MTRISRGSALGHLGAVLRLELKRPLRSSIFAASGQSHAAHANLPARAKLTMRFSLRLTDNHRHTADSDAAVWRLRSESPPQWQTVTRVTPHSRDRW